MGADEHVYGMDFGDGFTDVYSFPNDQMLTLNI